MKPYYRCIADVSAWTTCLLTALKKREREREREREIVEPTVCFLSGYGTLSRFLHVLPPFKVILGQRHVNHPLIDHPYKCHENINGSRVPQLSKAPIYQQIKVRSQKSKQKSPGRAPSRRRSQPLTPEGREKVTQINMCIANKQIHDKHKDQLPLPQARGSKC